MPEHEIAVVAILDDLISEADALFEEDPDGFDAPAYNQPTGTSVRFAEDVLPEDAPWHHIGHVAHALDYLEHDEPEGWALLDKVLTS